jgi:hypothetical protein
VLSISAFAAALSLQCKSNATTVETEPTTRAIGAILRGRGINVHEMTELHLLRIYIKNVDIINLFPVEFL